ncbi:tetratricopeptide repeat protein [Nocardia sp. SC052]|uniref:tetratricopeptide repeat protein n=1 Tax=Nocardia sichangensis TaxID=3385975 RepID=UPI0039A09619
MSSAREPIGPATAASLRKVSARGNVEVTTNHYYEGSATKARARPSPLAGSGVGVSGLVPQEPEHFIERAQIDDLETGLAGERIAVVVTGMRGAGKTHLAAAYARRILAKREGLVAWINAETPETLYTGLAAIADRFGVTSPDGDTRESARLLRDYLGSNTGKHLLVFDNAEHVELIREVLPVHGGSRVVITTTNQAMTALTPLVVDAGTGYTSEQARAFLREATGITDDPDGENTLAQELGYLPLALAAAAAAIRPPSGPRLTYPAYLQRLRAKPLPQALQPRVGQEYRWSVDRTLLLAIEAAEAPTDNRQRDQVVGWLLGLFAILAASGVDRTLLIHPDPHLNEHVDEAIAHCVRRFLLSWSTTGQTLLAHRLIARVLLERARANDDTGVLVLRALDVIEPRLFSRAEGWVRRAEGAHLVDQIEAIRHKSLINFSAPEPPRGGWLRRRRSSSLPHALQIRTVNALTWATRQLIAAVDLQRATVFAQRTFTDAERVLGPDHPDTLTTRSDVAAAYLEADQPVEAIPLYERALVDAERVLGPDRPETLVIRSNLATAYQSAGRTTEAIPLHERTLADFERVLGPDHPYTVGTRGNLANTYESEGRTTEAIPLHERTLADFERVLGPDHSQTLTTRTNLAAAYQSAGRSTEAIPLLEQALADLERVLGPDHPHTLTARGKLAGAYESVGRTTETIPLLERTLTDLQRVLGPEHRDTLTTRSNLVAAYQSAGRSTEAIPLLEQALADLERMSDPDHPEILTIRGELAGAYESVGRTTEAIPLLEQTLTDAERMLGPDDPEILAARNHLADLYEAADRLTEAISLLERILTGRERVLGPDHPETLVTCNNLAGAYESAGRLTEAIPLLERALAGFERILGAAHPHTLTTRSNLAHAFQAIEQQNENSVQTDGGQDS